MVLSHWHLQSVLAIFFIEKTFVANLFVISWSINSCMRRARTSKGNARHLKCSMRFFIFCFLKRPYDKLGVELLLHVWQHVLMERHFIPLFRQSFRQIANISTSVRSPRKLLFYFLLQWTEHCFCSTTWSVVKVLNMKLKTQIKPNKAVLASDLLFIKFVWTNHKFKTSKTQNQIPTHAEPFQNKNNFYVVYRRNKPDMVIYLRPSP